MAARSKNDIFIKKHKFGGINFEKEKMVLRDLLLPEDESRAGLSRSFRR